MKKVGILDVECVKDFAKGEDIVYRRGEVLHTEIHTDDTPHQDGTFYMIDTNSGKIISSDYYGIWYNNKSFKKHFKIL